MHVSAHTYSFWLLLLRELEINGSSDIISHCPHKELRSQCQGHFPVKRTMFLTEMIDSGAGPGKAQDGDEHFVILENGEVLNNNNKMESTNSGIEEST